DISHLSIGACPTRRGRRPRLAVSSASAPVYQYSSTGRRKVTSREARSHPSEPVSKCLRLGAYVSDAEAQVGQRDAQNMVLAVAELADDIGTQGLLGGQPVEAERIGSRSAFAADLHDEAHGDRMLARVVEERRSFGGEVFGDVERGDRGRNDRQRHRAEV